MKTDPFFFLKEICIWVHYRIRAYKVVHTLIPSTCGHAVLQEKRDLADVIEREDIKMGRVSWTISYFENLKVNNFFLLGQKDAT